MKKSIIFLSILIYATDCFAQKQTKLSLEDFGTSDLKTKTYVENPYLDKFSGKWIWEQGAEKFTVEFKKKGMRVPGTDQHLTVEMLNGDYRYYTNGKKSRYNNSNYPLIGVTNSDNEPLVFFVDNPNNGTTARCEIHYIDKNTLQFSLVKGVSEVFRNWFPLPKVMTLKRIQE